MVLPESGPAARINYASEQRGCHDHSAQYHRQAPCSALRFAMLLLAAAALVPLSRACRARPPTLSDQPQLQPQPRQPAQQPDQTPRPMRAVPPATTASSPCPKRTHPTSRRPLRSSAASAENQKPEGMRNVSLHVDVPEVTVDVGVLLEKTGQFVPGLKPIKFPRLRRRRGAEGRRLQARRGAHHRAAAVRVCRARMGLPHEHAQRRLGLYPAVAPPGLRGHR